MKNKVVDIILFIGFICLAGVAAYSIYNTSKLETVIENQNNFIKEVTGKESEFVAESQKYRDSIVSYTKEITYLLNGKTLTSDQFVDAYDRLRSEKDSINTLYNQAKKFYGFEIIMEDKNDSTTLIYSKGNTRADSADIAYRFFKDRIKRNQKGLWTADLTSKEDLNKLNKQIKSNLKKMLDTSALPLQNSQKNH